MDKRNISANFEKLRKNKYPGRGIIIGMTPDSRHMVQVYWIMGRSENSRNRVFAEDDGFVRTKAFDESKLSDPSLIIYYPVKHLHGRHIVTNGDQTDTIYDALAEGCGFESALEARSFEPDAPHFTPRISGIVNMEGSPYAYQLSILKSGNASGDFCSRYYFNYEKGIPGTGHCIHTYSGDGNPLPSFSGEPYELELFDDIGETARYYWNALDESNKVSLLVKYIEIPGGNFRINIINKNK
jgi:IMP cyclohydrolase